MKSLKSSGKPKRPKLALRRVVGESMIPALRPGQIVLVADRKHLRTGDVVMIRHGGLEKIKRVARLEGDLFYVLGDNSAASTDSRNFGWLQQAEIAGKVIWPKSCRAHTSDELV